MNDRVLVVDALSAGRGQRATSRDSIGSGPRTVAGVLEKRGVSCRIHRVEDLLSNNRKMTGYDVLAVSAMTMDLAAVEQLVRTWRRQSRHGPVLVGGPIASDPLTLLREVRPDLVVIGEAELTLRELLDADALASQCNLEDVRGIAYLSPHGPKITAPRPLVPPDRLSDTVTPSTTRIVDYATYQASKVYVEVLRGCSNYRRPSMRLPNGRLCNECGNCESEDPMTRLDCPQGIPPGCGFCSVPGTWGPPRSRSVESIAREIRELVQLGVHRVVLEAPDFLDYFRAPYPLTDPCHPRANLDAIRSLLSTVTHIEEFRNGSCHLSIENIKACLLDDRVAELLSELLPGSRPNIGVETGSASHMKRIGKCGSPDDVIRAVRTAHAHGMSPFVYFIYGLPEESPESVAESVALMRQLSEAGAGRIILYGFQSLPCTAFDGFPDSNRNDPVASALRKEANRINLSKKEDYVGRLVRGIAAEPSWEHFGQTIVYGLENGPMMTVTGGFSPGTVVTVRVTSVVSPSLLAGEVIPEADTAGRH
ncbi:MAG: B12-binding domain-containing radical SAM protein [Candidatus Thorarchaeota archaeon]|nr:B12-binding domain-containing radical SAM protein [Candidatus Thorarchaeota archaeon]